MSTTLTFHVEDDLGEVVFDQPGSSANVFNEALLDELDAMITTLEQQEGLKAVLFRSAKPAVFIAGADLNQLCHLRDPDLIREVSRHGQSLFDRIRALPFTTVALIHGAALGGGAEFALACDLRVASRAKATKIGFPETQLGILPAWGGCSYLPALVGQAKALQLILTGKQLPAKKALRMGLVDRK